MYVRVGRSMGRVWVCMILYFSQIHYSQMVVQKQVQDLGGLGCSKNQRTCVEVRGRIVSMGRVGMCMLLSYSQIQYSHMVAQNQTRGLGVELRKKPKDLSASERQYRDMGG